MSTINPINNTTSLLNITGSASGSITMAAQAAAGTYNFNLPTSAGTAGQALVSGGGGVNPMTWANIPGGGASTVNVQTFTTSGTYTPTAGMIYCLVEVVGGGGGGGGVPTTTLTDCASAGGGGAGGYARGLFSASTIGASQAITIGAGGSASGTGNNPGGNGGTTQVGSLISASGGLGGNGDPASSYSCQIGGLGGSGTGGDFQTTGNPGGTGFGIAAGFVFGGNGGSSFFGGGGITASFRGNGQDGVSYGGGGGGACNANSGATPYSGGSGAPGIVVITEYIS